MYKIILRSHIQFPFVEYIFSLLYLIRSAQSITRISRFDFLGFPLLHSKQSCPFILFIYYINYLYNNKGKKKRMQLRKKYDKCIVCIVSSL